MVTFHVLCDGKKNKIFWGFCVEMSSFFAKILGALSNWKLC